MVQSSPSVISIEFNELTPHLVEKFIRAGQLPNFKKFYDESHIYVTDAEEEGENLNPWVQWVSVHSGMSAAEHGIYWLSDGHKLSRKVIWDVLSDHGLKVWVCGSMNARYDKPLQGYLLPDPWASGLTPFPAEEFATYYRFVRNAVQEHTRPDGISKAEALKFLAYMTGHGLSFRTVRTILSQLWTERVTKKYRWKRATILDALQWDVFAHYYRRLQPHFSTFFLNSTAHFQHCYWRNMEPERYTIKPLEEEQQEYRDAILFGYQNMDAILGRMMKLARPQTTLIFSTALSQQPYLKFEASGGRHYYRVKKPAAFKQQLGINEPFTVNPVMAEQFCFRFESEASAAQALNTFNEYRVGEKLAFNAELRGNDIMFQCNMTNFVPHETVVRNIRTNATIPFFDLFYEMEDLKSAFHHPDGMLWVRHPNREHRIHEEKVSLMSVAPAVLKIFNVPRPEFMTRDPFSVVKNKTSKAGEAHEQLSPHA